MKIIFKYLFLLLLIFPIYSYAEEININRKGSFKINYLYGDKKLNGEIKIYKVANMDLNQKFTYLDEYTLTDSLEVDSVSKWNDLAQKIYQFITTNHIDSLGSCITENGVCQLSNLDVGLYLVTSKEVTDNSYLYKASPTLIALPNYNEVDNVYVYEEDIMLKTEAKAISVDNHTTVVPKTIDMFYTYLTVFVVSVVFMVFVVLYIKKLKKKEKRNEKDN